MTVLPRGPVYTVADLAMQFLVIHGPQGPGLIDLGALRQFSVDAETDLQSQINAEKADRIAADSAEAKTRASADTQEAQTRATADATEASTRAQADTTLGNRIAALEALTPRRAILTYPGSDLTWTFSPAFASGVVPIIEALAEGPATSNALFNVQTVGAPTNTSVRLRVNTIPAASVSLLGLVNLNLFQQAPSGVRLHLTAFAP